MNNSHLRNDAFIVDNYLSPRTPPPPPQRFRLRLVRVYAYGADYQPFDVLTIIERDQRGEGASERSGEKGGKLVLREKLVEKIFSAVVGSISIAFFPLSGRKRARLGSRILCGEK